MTDTSPPSDLSTLDARRGSTRVELSGDAMDTAAAGLSASLDTMDELVSSRGA